MIADDWVETGNLSDMISINMWYGTVYAWLSKRLADSLGYSNSRTLQIMNNYESHEMMIDETLG